MSIKFDNVEILTTAYMPQYAKHETAPDRVLNTLPLAREDGEVLISERYNRKIITLRGTLKATTQANLDTAIDGFKELFSRPEKNLDVAWAGGTRRYVATCVRHSFDRDHYHTTALPWSAEFVVASGIGKDTTATLARDEAALTTDDEDVEGDFIAEDTFTLSGSKAPEPVITLEIVDAASNMKGIEYTNLDTNERIIINRNVDWSAATGKQIKIDCENKRVLDNLATDDFVEGPFHGVFPRFKLGTNNVRIRSGGFVNQRSSDTDAATLTGSQFNFSDSQNRMALSFQVPYQDSTFSGVTLGLTKIGTPTTNLFAFVQTDDEGKPSGSSLASFTFDQSTLPGYPDYEYINIPFAAIFSLSPNTTYWLVVGTQSGVDVSNHPVWNVSESITYPRGRGRYSTNGGTTWQDMAAIPSFRLLMGGFSAATEMKHSVSYTKTYL
jgi:hypothetical protein